MAAAAVALAPCARAQAQDYSAAGPYATAKWKGAVTIAPTTTTSTVTVDVIVTYPTGSGPFPVVAMFNGFQASGSWYGATADRVASWGYVVLQYTHRGFLPIVVDRIELGYLTPLLNWLKQQGESSTSALYGRPNTKQLATMGHSRGGKLATLHYATRSDVSTAVLLDPVDGSSMTPESTDYPSSTKALAAAGGKKLAVIGAGITGSCNPASYNYKNFTAAGAPGSWEMLIKKAGHAQFYTSATSFFGDLACGRNWFFPTSTVISLTNTLASAWLESVFRPIHYSETSFDAYVQNQVKCNVITYSVKPAPPK